MAESILTSQRKTLKLTIIDTKFTILRPCLTLEVMFVGNTANHDHGAWWDRNYYISETVPSILQDITLSLQISLDLSNHPNEVGTITNFHLQKRGNLHQRRQT